MGLYSIGLVIGRIFASEIWGAYFFGGGGGGGWGGGLLSKFYGIYSFFAAQYSHFNNPWKDLFLRNGTLHVCRFTSCCHLSVIPPLPPFPKTKPINFPDSKSEKIAQREKNHENKF